VRIAVLPPKNSDGLEQHPWRALCEGLSSRGATLLDGSVSPRVSVDALVAMNHHSAVSTFYRVNAVPASRRVLIVLEPRATAPRMYRQQAFGQYSRIYCASPEWARELGGMSFRWPQDLSRTDTVLDQWYQFDATLINADKRSAIETSWYGLRRSVWRLADTQGLRLAVVGPGWQRGAASRVLSGARACVKAVDAHRWPNWTEAFSHVSSRPKHALGPISDKARILALAPFSIVIENSPDYVSEKLIDVVRCGAVPIYVGPRLSDFGLPDSIAIQVEPIAEAILDAITCSNERLMESTKQVGSQWISSRASKDHEGSRILFDLGARIATDLAAT
jgi:hypothetical protein